MERSTIGVAILVAVIVGCGGGGGTGKVCAPGASASCTCTTGRMGAQVCTSDGAGYGACMCSGGPGAAGTTGDAGTTGGAGATGTAGVAGNAGGAGSGGTSAQGGAAGGPACPVGCCAAPNPGMGGTTILADSVVGFSDTQNKCDWSYGYLPNGAEPFTLLSVFTGASWEEATSRPPWTVIFGDRQHSTAGPVHWSDRRWTSPGAGTISIQGHLAKTDPCCGDGTIGRIRVGGNEIWSANVAFDDTTGVDFALSATVLVGTTVDFILDPKSNESADTTAFTAVITK